MTFSGKSYLYIFKQGVYSFFGEKAMTPLYFIDFSVEFMSIRRKREAKTFKHSKTLGSSS